MDNVERSITTDSMDQFTADDAALMLGRLVIENYMLRKGGDELRNKVEALRKQVEEYVLRPKGPTLVTVERAPEGGDASSSGEA